MSSPKFMSVSKKTNTCSKSTMKALEIGEIFVDSKATRM